MRVVAGTLGGRTFDSPNTSRTHPMSEKMRGAIFNTLGDLDGLTVLDAYSGSGALAIEAVSRGAKRVLAVEQDKTAAATIQHNVVSLGIGGQIKAVHANIHGWSANNRETLFDIVLCDPPYPEANATNIEKLLLHLKPGGLLVLSWPGGTDAPMFTHTDLARAKDFGDSQALFYRKRSL